MTGEIIEEIQQECSKYGPVLEVVIPDLPQDVDPATSGKVYVKFTNQEDSAKAIKALAGRKFSDRIVVACYYSEDKFDQSELVPWKSQCNAYIQSEFIPWVYKNQYNGY